jgi:predicted RNA-binding protein YlxR (DUF448 family)
VTRRGHTPIRTCVGCRRRTAKSSLERFVALPETGALRLAHDRTGRMPGRGVYLCPRRACMDLAVERRAFGRVAGEGRALRLDPALYESFEEAGSGRVDGD